MSEKKQPEAVLLGGIDLNNVKRLRRHQVQTEAREQMQRDTQDGWAYSWVTWNRDNAIAGQKVITYVELSEGDQDVVHLWVHNYDDEGDAKQSPRIDRLRHHNPSHCFDVRDLVM